MYMPTESFADSFIDQQTNSFPRRCTQQCPTILWPYCIKWPLLHAKKQNDEVFQQCCCLLPPSKLVLLERQNRGIDIGWATNSICHIISLNPCSSAVRWMFIYPHLQRNKGRVRKLSNFPTAKTFIKQVLLYFQLQMRKLSIRKFKYLVQESGFKPVISNYRVTIPGQLLQLLWSSCPQSVSFPMSSRRKNHSKVYFWLYLRSTYVPSISISTDAF